MVTGPTAFFTWICLGTTIAARAALPADYQGKSFADAVHKAGPPNIPGIVQCALYDLGGKPAATCRLPAPTPSYHHWNFADIGTIQFPEAGLQLLTFHYGKGNNFAYFEFEPVELVPPERH
jgi:hypothetical protein